jgi:hypothetical protein
MKWCGDVPIVDEDPKFAMDTHDCDQITCTACRYNVTFDFTGDSVRDAELQELQEAVAQKWNGADGVVEPHPPSRRCGCAECRAYPWKDDPDAPCIVCGKEVCAGHPKPGVAPSQAPSIADLVHKLHYAAYSWGFEAGKVGQHVDTTIAGNKADAALDALLVALGVAPTRGGEHG